MRSMLTIDGTPTFLLGVNYWSRSGGPRMWDRFNETVVRREVAQMHSCGLNVCRSFAFIPSFMPAPPALNPQALQKLRLFFDICHDEGLWTIPTALVGHMSGENYDFVGQAERSLYRDPELLSWEQAMLTGVASVSVDHPAVIAYLASNEMPYWGGRSDPITISRWARALRQSLCEVDPARPFSLGDGVMNLHGGENGFDPRAMRAIVDFVGPHTYYADLDSLRQALNAEYCIRSLTYLGLPVIFEEFGCSTTQASEENQQLYYREVIHACIGAGAAGALGWCFSDFDLIDERPYQHHAFELGFGITRADGSEKPVCNELRSLKGLLDQVSISTLEPPQCKVAILVPSTFNTTYPFSWEDKQRMQRTLLQSYVICVASDLEAELVPEDLSLDPYQLVLVPATQKLLSPTWRALLEHARRGHTVYWSYFGGDYNVHQGAWCSNFTELTGCRHSLRYGCFDLPQDQLLIQDDEITIKVDTRIEGGKPFPRARLPVNAMDTNLIARDQNGDPALVERKHGAGRVIFSSYPLEYYLAEQAETLTESGLVGLYRLLAQRAGIDPAIKSSEPAVQSRVLQSSNGSLLWLFNHSWSTLSSHIRSPGGKAAYFSADTQVNPPKILRAGVDQVELAPKQGAVYHLSQD